MRRAVATSTSAKAASIAIPNRYGPCRETKPFGRPSVPGDYVYQTPELLGSERNGPDLSNIGARQPSSVWQYIHLYQPRAVVPQSIMPAFPWLFQVQDKQPAGELRVPLPPEIAPPNGVVVPTEDGKALVAYLLSLKQPKIEQPGAVAAKAPPGAAGGTPAFDTTEGEKLYAANCAACHGADGKGIPGAFPLSPAIPSLTLPILTATSASCCMALRVRK